jgi:hypothetical protein
MSTNPKQQMKKRRTRGEEVYNNNKKKKKKKTKKKSSSSKTNNNNNNNNNNSSTKHNKYEIKYQQQKISTLMCTILVGRPETYLPMFDLMWRSLDAFNQYEVDFLVVGNAPCLQALREGRYKRPRCVRSVMTLTVPVEDDLHDALLRKLDVVDFPGIQRYSQVMYLDCDIIIKTDLRDIFERTARRADVLHAPVEYEDFNHPFFGFERYSSTEIGDMRKLGSTTFNDGIFVFHPTSDMLAHLRGLRAFARSATLLRRKYYDQSFFNDYFNRRGLARTGVLAKRVVIFPKEGRLYRSRRIAFVHFAGLQGYSDKARRMREYLELLLAYKTIGDGRIK